MKTSLRQIAAIRTGIFAKPEPKGEVAYLQVRYFDKFGNLAAIPQPDLRADSQTQKHLLRDSAVLFAAKGWKNFATVYRGNFPAVASTAFFILETNDSSVLPEYLAWLLNQQSTQDFLKRHATGTAIVSISKSVLENLQVTIPSVEKQKQILEISRLSRKENEIRLKIAELRQLHTQQEIDRAIK